MIKLELMGYHSIDIGNIGKLDIGKLDIGKLDIGKLDLEAKCAICKGDITPQSYHLRLEVLYTEFPYRRLPYRRLHFRCFDRVVEELMNVQKELEQLKTELVAKVL